MIKHFRVKDYFARSINSWVRDSRLAELDPEWEKAIEEMRSSGEKIESRLVKDGNGEAMMYRLVRLRKGGDGEWRCTSCYTNISKAYAEQLQRTLAENVRQGYCTDCKKKRIFQPA